ncbi:MAG: choice-of-anchor E domain-containing protein [Pseudomonadota bacterium]
MSLRMLAAVAATVCATTASAKTLVFTETVNIQSTDWTEILSIKQFNPLQGTLFGVTVSLEGTVEGAAAAESHDQEPATITLDLSSLLSVSNDALGEIVTVEPLVQSSFDADAFDGVYDFNGPSGTSFGGLSAMEMAYAMLTPGDLALFVGSGDVEFTVTAQGQSSASGPGNLATLFSTQASAVLNVTYDFSPLPIALVPTPGSGALALGGVGMLVLARRRRAKA